jgi:translation initiation factor IF-2
MAKMKIFELKNLINEQIKGSVSIESKDIQDFLEHKLGVKKTHSSNLEDAEVQAVRNHFVSQTKSAPTPATRPQATAAPRPSGEQASQRPAAQGLARPATAGDSGQRLAAQTSGTRPMGSGQPTQRPTATNQGSVGGQSGVRPAGQGSQNSAHSSQGQFGARQTDGGSRPNVQQAGVHPANTGTYQGQRPSGDQGARPAGQQGMRQGGQSGQNYSTGTGYTGGQGYQGQRPAGDQGARPAGQQGMRQGNQSGQNYSTGTGYTGGQGYQGQRPAGEQGARPAGQQGGARQGSQSGQGYQGQRPSGDGTRPAGAQGGMRQGNQGYQGNNSYQGNQNQGYQGQRSTGDGSRPAGQQGGGRPSGQGYQGQGYQGQRYAGDGTRPAGQQGGQRQGGNGYQGNQGYQGQRPAGDRPYNNQGQRPAGDRPYNNQGQRPAGDRPYNNQGQRPVGDRPYNNQGGNRPSGYQGQRSNDQGGNGYQGGQGYQNRQRPYNQDGSRPAGQDGNRPYRNNSGTQGNYSRPYNTTGGQRPGGGYGQRGPEEFNKDEDDKPSYGNRAQGAKKGSGRVGERKNFDQQILDQKVAEKNDNSNKRNRDRINKEKNYKDKNLVERDDNDIDEEVIINKIAPKKGQFIQPKPVAEAKEEEIKTIIIPEVLTIKDLAEKMKQPSSALIKKLFLAGKIVTLNQEITFEEAEEIAMEYEIITEKEVKVNEVEELLKEDDEDTSTMEKRPPVVCVMGHVDHGKTSLLDAIRVTNVTSREAGGITQHIGAYVVEVNGEKITFLDTPGHEAFTSMRMRGAKSTDIAILVVAADDGVMPQTVEAINHAKAAGVQIIVAINKIDKPSANVERVKQELTEYELIAEDWGGETIFVPVSAHTKEGIEQLLEMILLTAEMIELKANPNRNARGIVIEAELDKGRGPVATILVQKGTLHVGDNIAVGASFGKVRAMMDDKGRRVKEALPSTPVEILGLNEVPDAGETFLATDNEKEARTIAEAFISQGREKLIADTKAKLSLDGLFSQIQAGNIKELNLIIKADVQGSVEAMKQSLLKLSNDEVAVRIIHGGVGAINESDVKLASASNAIIIGFNVRPDNAAKETADREAVDVKFYRVIYNAINDIEAAMKGLLDPVFEERIIGHAEIRMTFKASGVGTIAGSYVLDGKIQRGCKARVYRGNDLIFEGNLASLKRFQDDVKEVATGYECGLVFEKFNDVKEGDKVELYIMAEVPR